MIYRARGACAWVGATRCARVAAICGVSGVLGILFGYVSSVCGRSAKRQAKGAISFFLLFLVGVYKLPVRERGPNCIETPRNAPSPISRSFSATTSLLDAAPIGNFAQAWGAANRCPHWRQRGRKKSSGGWPGRQRRRRKPYLLPSEKWTRFFFRVKQTSLGCASPLVHIPCTFCYNKTYLIP